MIFTDNEGIFLDDERILLTFFGEALFRHSGFFSE